MKKILIGTTNPSKVNRYRTLLKDYNIDFLTLNDLNISSAPLETGKTPEENALIKAKYYSQFFDTVICGDSGLYFLDYPLDNSIQPGLKIRRVHNQELNDEEMIAYYSHLASLHGGKLLACYVDGTAVYNQGQFYSFMEYGKINWYYAFYLHDHIVDEYTPGWPLDGLSEWIDLYDEDETKKEKEAYQNRFNEFLNASLKLK